MQWLNQTNEYNSDYLKYEFDQRCKEEEKQKHSNKRHLYYCERAKINDDLIAFFAYSNNVGNVLDCDEERLKIYQLQIEKQPVIPSKRFIEKSKSAIEPKTKK